MCCIESPKKKVIKTKDPDKPKIKISKEKK